MLFRLKVQCPRTYDDMNCTLNVKNNLRGHLVHLINMNTEVKVSKQALGPEVSVSNQFYCPLVYVKAITDYQDFFKKQLY